MWTFVKKVLSRSRVLNSVLGEIVFETPEVTGESSRSFFQWRVKKTLEGDRYFVGLRMRPDAYAGSEGSPTNFMNFDIETAQRVRAHLDRCIAECDRLMKATPRTPAR